MTRKVFCIIGTRPEAIKMAPVVKALRASTWASCVVVSTAQHRDMLDPMLDWFGIAADHDLNLMRASQQPGELLSRMLPGLEALLRSESADMVLAQGDTATTFGAALAAFQCRLPFGHVEAGLRTHDLSHPFPEEGYRQMVSRIARWHFAPTERDARALRAEGLPTGHVHVTGNTCIDALFDTKAKLGPVVPREGRLILLTAHRRESFGKPLHAIFSAVLDIVERFPDVRVVYPVHPNPNVRGIAMELLGSNPRIDLREPMEYHEFVDMMRQSTLIMTDSGGIQEEAPALGKPVLVLREITERPEVVEAGVARVVGTEQSRIVECAASLLSDAEAYGEMAKTVSPFGDGHAAERIVDILSRAEEQAGLPA